MEHGTKRITGKLFNIYILLSAFFIGNALLAEFIGVKIFNLEHALGLLNEAPTEGKINLSIGVIIWPFVFITSDILNEYFGKKGVRRISFITAGIIAYASLIVAAGTSLPPADFWLKANNVDASGNIFDINFAYTKIFRMGIGIVIGSITAFLVSQLVDVHIFHFFRKITGHKYLWVRATGSTVISQLIDSYLILFIAFYVLGNWSLDRIFSVGTFQYIYKVSFAIVLTPLIYIAHHFIDKYLGRSNSQEIIEEADKWQEKTGSSSSIIP